MHHYYWVCALESESCSYWSLSTATTKAHAPSAHGLQQEEPPQWEAHTLQLETGPHATKLEKAWAQWGPNTAINKYT